MTGDEETKKGRDVVGTALGLRVWRYDRSMGVLCSVNAGQPARHTTWIATAMASPEGEWSPGVLTHARCSRSVHEDGVPDPRCSCGIYATTSVSVVNDYLSPEAPVLGVVELGGRIIPGSQGYRAQAARVAAVLQIDAMFTLPYGVLGRIADRYRVPLLVPHSVRPEDYRSLVRQPDVGDVDWDDELRRLTGEGEDK
jgi:hypothetical protein